MKEDLTKVAIIGAGFVGSTIAYTLAANGTVSDLVLIDVNEAKAEGEVMDINHGLAYLGQINIYAGDYSDVKDCDLIIITAGMNRKPGESRLDLAKKNATIAKEITKNIMAHYNGGVILVVSNPVDVLTYIIQKESKLPAGRVIGTGTMLDSSRFRYTLSQQLKIDVRNIHGFIVGEHGDSQITVWSKVNVGGLSCDDYCEAYNVYLNKSAIEEEVRTAGAQVIKRKGTTHYAIACAVSRAVESILMDQRTILPVSLVINGDYSIHDVALSLPCIVSKHGITEILKMSFDDDELGQLQYSAAKLKEVLKQVAQ